jgi:hypothetical protein
MKNPMSVEKLLARIEELEKKATLDWVYEDERYSAKCVIGNKPHDDRWIAGFQPEFNGEINARLAVALRNAFPALAAVIRVQKEALAKLALNSADPDCYHSYEACSCDAKHSEKLAKAALAEANEIVGAQWADQNPPASKSADVPVPMTDFNAHIKDRFPNEWKEWLAYEKRMETEHEGETFVIGDIFVAGYISGFSAGQKAERKKIISEIHDSGWPWEFRESIISRINNLNPAPEGE